MREGLLIGETAKALGITPKAIRYYHRIGLLAEPGRSPGGYRLYNAAHVLRLYRIRHLQSLGLSLAQVRAILGSPDEGISLRRALITLRGRLSEEMAALQAQLDQVDRLLGAGGSPDLASLTTRSPSFERLLESLGDRLAEIPLAVIELDRQLFARLDGLLRGDPSFEDKIRALLQHLVSHPEEYRQMIALASEITSLTDVSPDSYRVEETALALRELLDRSPLFATLAEVGSLEHDVVARVLGEVARQLVAPSLSPAQQRLFQLVAGNHLRSTGPSAGEGTAERGGERWNAG
ncbi:MAG TPA: MerR family transcriptional regulator [Chloroflexota bacterium]|nr:MerR family transcriptional regulator [Chloroflexota bacterium]